MAIDWAMIKSTITPLIADISGLGAQGVKWRDDAREAAFGYQPIIYLRISSVRFVGIEEELREDNGTDDQTVTVYGQREFTLSIRCESSVVDIADARHPEAVLERVATRLARTSSNERIHPVFAIQDYERIAYVPYFEQGKQVDAYVLDVQCNTISVDVDDTVDSGGYVDEVVLSTSDIKNDGGDVLGTIAPDIDTGPPDTDP